MGFVIALIFLIIGMALGGWYFDAHRRWLDALARHGEVSMGGAELLRSGPLRPRRAAATLIGIARRAYPRTQGSPYRDVELWRMRRRRRLILFVGWMFAGAPLAILMMIAISSFGSSVALLLIALVVIVAALVSRAIRRYVEYELPPDE